ncbi:MAG: hypothetical protein EBR82_39045 [Caulobacteraceae bacterium]|nr:hypothetical protein [Caulobacteraceae bacterium]
MGMSRPALSGLVSTLKIPCAVEKNGRRLYDPAVVRQAIEAKRAQKGEVSALKEQRLQQQIRKDRIANDLKEGLLMRRAEWAAACAVGGTRWNGFVARYRSEFPAHHAKAADSLPEQRAVVDMAIAELSAFLIPMLDVGKAPRKAVEEAVSMLQARLAEMPIENPSP